MKADRKAYQDQKQVQKLGNQRGDGSTGNAHSGGTQLSEDEQIVQSGVRRYRAKTCPKGDSGVFLAAQPCGQDGADCHGQIRERHDAEVPRPHTEDGVICRIKSQDLRREAPCRQQKQCCQHTPADKAYIQTAPRLGVLLRTQKLCDQNTGNRADCAGHHGENKSEVTAQSHGCNTGFAQLPNHDLIHDRKGGLQHSL